jgi:UDP-N-acetylglucosamine 3-dehydrogenase
MMSSVSKLRVALVGLGRMGKNHLRVLQNSQHVKLVGVADVFAADPKLPNVPFAKDLREVQNWKPDLVVIATPTETHFEVATFFLRQKLNLLVEKPLATTSSRCQELIELASRQNCFVAVNHLERLNPAVRKLKDLVDTGRLGKPIHYSFTRVGGYPKSVLEGNNVLLDLAVHDLDILMQFEADPRLLGSIGHSNVRSDTLDTAELLLTTKSGASATLHANWITPSKIRTLRLTGTRGVAIVDYILQSCTLFTSKDPDAVEPAIGFDTQVRHYQSFVREEIAVDAAEPLMLQYEECAKALSGRPSRVCLAADAARSVSLAEEALERANQEFLR